MRRSLVLLACLLLLGLVAAPAGAEDEPTYRYALWGQVEGGSSPVVHGRRTVWGRVTFGALPATYEIKETRGADGGWSGRFVLYLERFEVAGTTRVTPVSGDSQYSRTFTINGGNRCFSPTGTMSAEGSIERHGAFLERLQGDWSCRGFTPSHGGPVTKDHRFSIRIAVTASSGASPGYATVIGRSARGIIDRGAVMSFTTGTGRASRRVAFDYWNGAGRLTGSFVVRVRRAGSGYRVEAVNGPTQISGFGDLEYRGAYATAPWRLRGRLDTDFRGTLTLSGRLRY